MSAEGAANSPGANTGPAAVLTGQLRPIERCSACGARFVCGHAAGLPHCWCATMPLLPARLIVPGQHCLCPNCLRARQAQAGRSKTGLGQSAPTPDGFPILVSNV